MFTDELYTCIRCKKKVPVKNRDFHLTNVCVGKATEKWRKGKAF